MGFGGFAGDGGDFDFGEAGFLEEGVEGAFFETEPDIGVEFAGLFEGVFVEVEDEELAAGAEDAEGLVDGGLGVLGVMERLGEDGEVDGFVRERDAFDVAELIGEIEEAVFLRELGADFDHAGRVVDAGDGAGAVGEELGNEALAGAEVGDVDGGGEPEREVADGFPGAAGAVVFAEAAGDEVEILFLGTAAFLEDAVEVAAVFGDDGEVSHGLDGGAQEREGLGRHAGAEGVEGFFALAAVGDEVDLPEERELGGDAGLAHAEDFLELGDGEFLARHEGEEAQAGGVGEGFEDVPGSVHAEETLGRFGIACKQALQPTGRVARRERSRACDRTDAQGAEAAGAAARTEWGGGETEDAPSRGRAEKPAGAEREAGAVFEQAGREGGAAEGGDDTVVGVGRRGAEAGYEAREPSGGEGTAETAQAGGSDGRSEEQSEDEAREAGGPGEPRRFWSKKTRLGEEAGFLAESGGQGAALPAGSILVGVAGDADD